MPKSQEPTLSRNDMLRLGQSLRGYYDDVTQEELPAAMTLQLMRLRAAEGGGTK